jgi:hypothetical protein
MAGDAEEWECPHWCVPCPCCITTAPCAIPLLALPLLSRSAPKNYNTQNNEKKTHACRRVGNLSAEAQDLSPPRTPNPLCEPSLPIDTPRKRPDKPTNPSIPPSRCFFCVAITARC